MDQVRVVFAASALWGSQSWLQPPFQAALSGRSFAIYFRGYYTRQT